ncbi:MAG: phosphoribosylformylglycinamidine cyclo-ligase [Lentisphaerae bacterium]|nr:phosphoribosylformylglycinamidine cyclo-ligase [Lentisphaerota bacterium]
MKKNTKKPVKSAYAAAGVDIDEMDRGLKSIKKAVSGTRTPGVLSEIGSFGGLFRSPGRGQVLVASTDGVGTKLKVAHMAGRHDTVGQCLVNHCVNDILTQGATPLFFLDYIGTAHLAAPVFASVVKGMCKACRENGCALLGGETAEMPGLYPQGEYDLVGTIVGVVDEKRIVTGAKIRPGDVLIGLPSTGLQTNGYSLARKIAFEQEKMSLKDLVPGTNRTFEDVLLAVHGSFLKPVLAVRESGARIHGMAHITGGGLVDNVPRMLPKTTDAVFDRASWKVPPIFTWLQEKGRIDPMEMFRVFNMGIGYVIAVPRKDAAKALNALERAKASPIVVGAIEKGSGITRFK